MSNGNGQHQLPPGFLPMPLPGTWAASPPPTPDLPPGPGGGRGRRSLVAGIVVAAAMVAAAVGTTVLVDGSGGGSAASRRSTTEVSDTNDEPTSTAPAASDEWLASLNVNPIDIGSNWERSATGTVGGDEADCQIPSGDGVEATHLVAYSLRPNRRDGTTQGGLLSLATVFADDGAALRQAGIDATAAHGTCLRASDDALWVGAGSGSAEPGTIEPVDQGVTQPAVGWRYRTTYAPPGEARRDGFVDHVIVRRGRVRLAFTLLSGTVRFDPALKELLIDRVAERVGAAIKAED